MSKATKPADLYLRLLVFVSGAAVMAVELTGLRLVAPYFGTSMIVTTILIGSMMAFLATGYKLGGSLGDKYPTIQALTRVTLSAGVLVIILPFVAGPILRFAASTMRPLMEGRSLDAGAFTIALVAGGLIGMLLLFAAPVILMGMTSPWAVRLAVSDATQSGKAAGGLYAVSTVGSIIGSFLPALVLVPLLGVRNTFVCTGALLAAVSAVRAFDAFKRLRGMAALAALAALLSLAFISEGTFLPIKGLVYEEDSIYHHIRVVVKPFAGGGCKAAYHLFLNEGVGIHSVKCLDPSTPTRGYWAYASAAALYRDDPESTRDVCIIGLAGGTMAGQILERFPNARIDGVEIDERIVEVGRKYFDNDDKRITPFIMDGRTFLTAYNKQYDFILVDAYRQPYIPFHLTTVEFWQEVKTRMKQDGIVGINVASVNGVNNTLLKMIYRTMREVFPTVFHVAATKSNDILIAALSPKAESSAYDHMTDVKQGSSLYLVKKAWPAKIHKEVEGWKDARILTDDQAPVEILWDLAALDYAGKDG
jgi:predicted membrane-bound spermidine synthase